MNPIRTTFAWLISRLRLWPAVLVCAALAVAVVIFLLYRAGRQVDLEHERLGEAAAVRVEIKPLRAPVRDGLTLLLNQSDVRSVARFRNADFFATSGGLLRVEGPSEVRRYTTLDGLPDNALTTLKVFRDRLYIGTESAGLVAFDGESFIGFTFSSPRATRVSALVATPAELLIGTLDGGLFEYDGRSFTRRINAATGADFDRVTALLPFESRIYIGTQNHGLYIWREGRIDRLSQTDGLPSPHVTAISPVPASMRQTGRIAIATDFGVVALDESDAMRPVSARPNVISLVEWDGALLCGLFTGGVGNLNADEATGVETAGLPRSIAVRLHSDGDRLWALTGAGAFMIERRSARLSFEPVRGAAPGGILSGLHVTGLALDSARRLWVGYFDAGVDVLATESLERISHLEDDRLREINYLLYDAGDMRMLAATSRGLVAIDGGFRQTVRTREKDGLAGDSVAHVAIATSSVSDGAGNALVLATAAGLTELSGGRARTVTAFHGLSSNHLYTSMAVGRRLYVGSLAGLMELEGLRVVRTYRTSNSNLSHDWVTGLVEVGGSLYIGTNGGGIDVLFPTGEMVNLSDELGRFEVNQNAMHFDGEQLFVGTTDRGLLIYNVASRRWTRLEAGLSSINVTSITTDDVFVYAGTLNGLTRIEKRILE